MGRDTFSSISGQRGERSGARTAAPEAAVARPALREPREGALSPQHAARAGPAAAPPARGRGAPLFPPAAKEAGLRRPGTPRSSGVTPLAQAEAQSLELRVSRSPSWHLALPPTAAAAPPADHPLRVARGWTEGRRRSCLAIHLLRSLPFKHFNRAWRLCLNSWECSWNRYLPNQALR